MANKIHRNKLLKDAPVLGKVIFKPNEKRYDKPGQFINFTPCESCEFDCKCMDGLIDTLINIQRNYDEAGIDIKIHHVKCKDFSRKESK